MIVEVTSRASVAISGQVNTGWEFIAASFMIAGAVLLGLALWNAMKLANSKKKLAMLEQASASEKD